MEYVLLAGTALTPQTLPWEQNDAPRQLDEALPLAASRGVSYPDDVNLSIAEFPANVFASYLLPQAARGDERWSWDRFKNRFDELVVRIRVDVLNSDEAIVAVLGHEAYELTQLRSMLPDGHTMVAPALLRLIDPNTPRNLHCRAWDDSDARIQAWRANR